MSLHPPQYLTMYATTHFLREGGKYNNLAKIYLNVGLKLPEMDLLNLKEYLMYKAIMLGEIFSRLSIMR